MKIESIIKRAKGTKVTLDSELYHFKPSDKDNRHLAEVTREAHIAAFLRIPEGFRLPDGEKLDKTLEKEIDESLLLKGSAVHSATYPIGGKDVSLDELVVMAFEDSALTRDDWNALEDEDRYGFIDRTLDDLQRAAAKAPVEKKSVTEEKAPARDSLPDPEGDDSDDENTDEAKSETVKGEQKGEELDRDALVELYVKKFGKKPHHSLKAERIKQVLDDAE